MASTIDIEVNLDSKEALKGLGKLDGAGEAVGETFNSMGQAVGKMGGEVNEKLGAMGESVGALSGSFKDLSSAAMAPGASFTALLGPIGAVVIGIIELSKAFDEYTGKAQEAEIRVESYRAATAELTTVVEELAAAQVNLNKAQIEELRIASMKAKRPLEEAQMIKEANATRQGEIEKLNERIKELRVEESGAAFRGLAAQAGGLAKVENVRITSLERRRSKIRKKIEQAEKRALKLTIEGAQETVKLEKKKEDMLKLSPKFKKELAEKERKIQEQAQIDSLQSAKDTQKAQIEIAVIQSKQKIREIRAIEDINEGVRYKAILGERKRLESQIADIEKSFADKRASARTARLNKELADKKIADAKRLMLERQTQNELFSLRALQIQQMKQAGATELQILESQHQLERDRARENHALLLAADIRFEMAKTELVKSQEAEREKARLDAFEKSQATLTQLRDSVQDQINQAGEFASAFGGAFSEAAFGAIFMGESIKESIAQIIFGLGKEAAVRSLMETAKGFASLVLNPAAALNHFTAASIFGGLAATAGGAGMALSSGGSGGGGGGSASPSGAPQIAPTPERESAQETSTVFNINFGGAVIYDTKQAAERAMVDRLVGVMNQRNRGARRLNLGRS